MPRSWRRLRWFRISVPRRLRPILVSLAVAVAIVVIAQVQTASNLVTIQLHVVDSRGDPMPLSTVTINGVPMSSMTDQHGNITISGLVSYDALDVGVSSVGYLPYEKELPASTVAAGGTYTVVLQLPSRLVGHLIDASGHPIVSADVWVGETYARSDASGTFVIEDIAPGTVDIVSTHAGLLGDAQVTVPAEKTAQVTIIMLPQSTSGTPSARPTPSSSNGHRPTSTTQPTPSTTHPPTPTASSTPGVMFLVVHVASHSAALMRGDPTAQTGAVVRRFAISAGRTGMETPLQMWTVSGSFYYSAPTTINGITYPAGPNNPDGLYYIALNAHGQATNYGLHDVADAWQSRVGVADLTYGGVGFTRADAQWLYQNLDPGTVVITEP